MPFYYQHPDKPRLDLDDLPLDSWIAIQDATGKTWPQMIGANTIGDAKVARAIVDACCKHLGVEPPANLSLRAMLEVLTYDRDTETVPTQFEDGLPDPKATGSDQATI